MTCPKLTEPRLFSLRLLAQGNRAASDIAISAQSEGLNRRRDDIGGWADLPLRELSDLGLAEETADRSVYRITPTGRRAIAT
jgi:hypothetical protein